MAKKRNVYKDSFDEKVPGVTTIINILAKPALIPWAAKMTSEYVAEYWKPEETYTREQIEVVLEDAKGAHRRKKTDAGDFGSDIHALVESYIGGQITPEQVMDKDQRRALENFIKETEGWEWLAAEIVVIHEAYACGCGTPSCSDPIKCEKRLNRGYGGTADGLARLPNGMIVISDTKTSKGVYPEVDLQVAMYANALPIDKELHGVWLDIQEARILHFDKERITWETLERDVKSQIPFIPHFREVYEWKKQFASTWS